jgi:histidyl-tRNA synthetase
MFRKIGVLMADFLSTKPCKGARDFYPEDMAFRREMFGAWRRVCESYAYGEVDGPLLEPLAMYAAKTSEEIVAKQIYHFVDRGGRDMVIRPEFTPTMARMAAARLQELPRPIRWFSLPNVWRYENPQRGRLREHWQLNVDVFGLGAPQAEVEVLCLAQDILKVFGARSEHYQIKINSRRVTDFLFREHLALSEKQIPAVAAALDKRQKIPEQAFRALLEEAQLLPAVIVKLEKLWACSFEELQRKFGTREVFQEMAAVLEGLESLGYGESLTFDLSVMRGFAYYTGLIFEVFDRHPENRRSLFGGGRYDNLVSSFSKNPLSGFGFGMGDVTFENFLKGHGLISSERSGTDLAVLVMGREGEDLKRAESLAQRLRHRGFSTALMDASLKMPKQITVADKMKINEVIFYGPEEEAKALLSVKNLETGRQESLKEEDLASYLKKNRA